MKSKCVKPVNIEVGIGLYLIRLQYCYRPEVIEADKKMFPAGDGNAFAETARMFGPCYGVGVYWEKR